MISICVPSWRRWLLSLEEKANTQALSEAALIGIAIQDAWLAN